MTKQAIFLACDYGIDGRAPRSIRFASLDEAERDAWIESSPNKAWLSPMDVVEDLEVAKEKALKKLDGLDRLALDLQQNEH